MGFRRILGVDPGSRITGFGVIEERDGQVAYVSSGCIKAEAKDSLPKRIRVIHQGLLEVVGKYEPVLCAMEEVFVNANPRSSLVLGQARGVCIAAVVSRDLDVFEYTPMQIKQAVVGYGKAQKNQVQRMVKELLELSGEPPPDAADALAVALTHAFRNVERDLGVPGRLIVRGGRYVATKK